MIKSRVSPFVLAIVAAAGLSGVTLPGPVLAEEVASVSGDAPAATDTAPSALTEDELNVLVARIALYPDDLLALISSAAVYPLQIVEASRYLDTVKSKPDEKPKDSWDGSVISLLNYPQVVKMMSDDLEWTQDLGTALAYQQQDVLVAIQQLRDEAVANGVIKSDDKVKVTNEGDNVVIQSASEDMVYIPEYPPEMLYEPDYDMVPISYYPDRYPYYYSPAATYFAGFVTGAIWGAAVDWNHWGVWGGNWGNDVEINCNKCFNDINGRVRAGDVDWRNVDRSKVSFDRDQFIGAKRDSVRASLESNAGNNLRTKATGVKRDSAQTAARAAKAKDVRASAQGKPALGKAGEGSRQALATPNSKPTIGNKATGNHAVGKPKAAARKDPRPRQPSGLGEVRSGKQAKVQSSRGHQAMSGRSGGQRQAVSHGGGQRPAVSRGGGRPSGGRGGGGGRHR